MSCVATDVHGTKHRQELSISPAESLEVIVRYIALAGATGAVGLRVGISNVFSPRPTNPPVSGPSTADRPSEFRRRVARGRCPGNGRLRPARLLCRQGRRGCDWPRTGTRTPLQAHPSG